MTPHRLKDIVKGVIVFFIPTRAKLPDDDPAIVKHAVEENQKRMRESVEISDEVRNQYRRVMAPINELLEKRIGPQNEADDR